jgi:hypothetical protein
MDTPVNDYYLQELFNLTRNGKSTLEKFNEKVQSKHQPSAKKVRARFQSIDSLLQKADQSGVLNYKALLDEGIWMSKFALGDIAKTKDSINFIAGHKFGEKPVAYVFLRAVNVVESAAEYYAAHHQTFNDYQKFTSELV